MKFLGPFGIVASAGSIAAVASAVACALALATFALALAGCSKVGTEPAAGGAAGGNPWTQHGVLRMANLSEPDTLNPVVGNQQVDSDLAMLWGGFFYNWNDANEYVPELVTAVPSQQNGGISKDGLTYTYHLRRGVTWQDGAPFDARDVIFTWHAIMNKKNNIPSTVGFDLITAIDTPDPYTLRVHLKEAWAPFVATFFNQSGTPYPVLPAHLLAKYPNINQVPYNAKPVGTGPFSVERWQRGSKIVFEANPHYWRGAPKLTRIEYDPIPNENTILTLLQSHEIDLEYRGAANNWEQLKNVPGTRAVLTDFNQYGQLALNVTAPLLGDVRVRKALTYALDFKSMIQRISHGVNALAYTDQPSFSWAFNPDTIHYAYDPAKAKQLLDAAGWKVGADGVRVKDGTRLSITIAGVTGSANGNAVDVLVQRYWKDVGVEAQVKNYISSLFFASYGAGGILQTGKFDAAFFSWIGGTDPDDSTLWMCDQFPPNGQNVYHFCDRTLDAAEKVALSSSDRAVRKKAYGQIQAILADRAPTIITWYTRLITVENTDLKNYKPAHAVTPLWNSWEWQI
jgi:peptide/nickel transport system substrate-binding protein